VPRERAIQIVAKQRRPPDERADKRDRQLARLILRTASPVNRRNVADALAGSDYRRTMKGIVRSARVRIARSRLKRQGRRRGPFAWKAAAWPGVAYVLAVKVAFG
jgi:hypothetical protein